MPNSPSETRITRHYIIKCVKCNLHIPPDSNTCPQCHTVIAPGTVEIDSTTEEAPPVATRAISPGTTNSLFAPNASVLLRFLPLGQLLSLSMRQPLLIGRAFGADVEKVLDLTDYGGEEHGISRQHCQLERKGAKLMLTDLGSTNGTYLNGKALIPHKNYVVAHGDRLILGTLHILVLFSTRNC